MLKERIAALLILVPMAATAAVVAWLAGDLRGAIGHGDTVVFNLTGVGADGVWTLAPVNGLNYWWRRFEPATLQVKVGQEVVLHLRSADVLHRFYLPAYALGPVDVEPGHTVTLRFTAERRGVFQYYCTSMCGGCHFYMRGWLVVSAADETPIEPPPILCTLCRPDDLPAPDPTDFRERGSYLYIARGCVTCHGPEGRGGVANDNSANSPVPAHDTMAEKLFLSSPEDAEIFIATLETTGDLGSLDPPPEIAMFPVVATRFENAKEIIRTGRYPSKASPAGPEPPLQMPAWRYIVDEREMDALIAYFVSLYAWDEG
jgi:mono/diheme cytochrome c family protein